MTHYVHHLLSISVQLLASAATSLALLIAAVTTVQAAPTPPPAPADLPIQIVVHTGDGVPVPGIVVTLHPASTDLGGPPTPVPDQQRTTNADGQVFFTNLGYWVWYATFHGTFASRAMQEPGAQGKPPWGTNPQGNGFPLVVDPQLENEANIATPATSVAPSIISRIVLVPGENTWIPELDLADEAATPISLPTAQAGTVPQAVDSLTPEPSAPGNSSTPDNLFWLALIAGIGVLALYLRWRQQLTVEPRPEILAGSLNDADGEPHPGPVLWVAEGEGSSPEEPSVAQSVPSHSSQGE